MSIGSVYYCVMYDTEYGEWGEYLSDYDVVCKSKSKAIHFAKQHKYGAVHKLTYTRTGPPPYYTGPYTCDMDIWNHYKGEHNGQN